MKHITERIRHKCNIISCTWDEYEILRIAFKAGGVKLRTTCFDADKVFSRLSTHTRIIQTLIEKELEQQGY